MTDIAELLKQHTDGVALKMDDYHKLAGELSARMIEIEQKSVRTRGSDQSRESIGARFVNDPGLKDFDAFTSRPSRFSMQVKTTITSALDSGGDLAEAHRDAYLSTPKTALAVRDLLPVVQVSSGSVEYPKLASYTNASDTVAEGDEKPESAMTFDLATAPIRTIAHWIPASRQILSDAPQLQDIINTELLYGLKYVEDDQLLNGGGTGQDLHGIVPQATAFAAGSNTVSSPTKIDVILYAILQNALADLPATGIVLHPSDWVSMLAIKDTAGAYILGDPTAKQAPSLFGLPIAQSKALTAGNFLVGDFATSATLYDRWEARVEVSTEHSDFFVRNLVALLCEERLGLAVKRPTGFTKGTFSTAITDLTS